MKKSNPIRTFVCVILAVTVLTAFAAMAAGGAGSQADPLVTLSYLTDTFTGQVLDKVGTLLTERNTALSRELTDKITQTEQSLRGQLSSGADVPAVSGESYAVVTLTAKQTLRGEAGCEVLLRSGSARCNGTGSTGLVDATSGGALDSGAVLTANHLYLMPESRSITTTDGATLLARGAYIVE